MRYSIISQKNTRDILFRCLILLCAAGFALLFAHIGCPAILIPFLFFFAPILVLAVAAVTMSRKYKTSLPYIISHLIRQEILLLLHAATLIYDPASVKKPCFEPETKLNPKDYVRIETFFEKETLPKNFALKEIRNEKIIRSGFDFSYQPYGEPSLELLRKEYKLDDVVETAKSEFEAMVLLRNWARSQFKRADYQPSMKDFNALEILKKNIRNPNNAPYQSHQYRPCNFFPLFYCQILLCMGYQSRLVRITRTARLIQNTPSGPFYQEFHGMTEVWSNQFKKWILMDPDLNLHYEKNGIPMNMLEIHNERYEKSPSDMKVIRGIHTAGDCNADEKTDADSMIQYHSYIEIPDMRNDWATNFYFRGHPKRSDRASLCWLDELMPPIFCLRPTSSHTDDFYWTLNQTEVKVKKTSDIHSALALAFETFTPNFKWFEIKQDDLPETVSADAVFEWRLHPGKNRLEVRSVNQYGICGISSRIEIWKE